MNDLRSRYKLAIIPAKTILFRQARDSNIYESMFFAFEDVGTYGTDYRSQIQVWETREPIISRLILKERAGSLKYETDLEYCFKQFCGEEQYHLNIKHILNPKRKPFLEFLKSNGIDSWVTSIENKSEMEVHLFTGTNEKKVMFKFFLEDDIHKDLAEINTYDNVILINPKEYV